MPHKNPEIRKKYLAQWRINNKQILSEYFKVYYKEHQKHYVKLKHDLREHKTNYLKNMFGNKCVICGSNEKLHFHHINPSEKLFDISDGVVNYSVERCIEEIKKCNLLCDKCHIIETKKQRQVQKI